MRNKTNHVKPDQIAGDRRQDRRYTIALELKYKLIRRRRVLEVGKGFTVDLSSGGVLFEAERPLPVGLNVELLIDWPVLLHNVAPMRLLISGKVVRGAGNRMAIESVQHEFRTQGTQSLTADPAARNFMERRGMVAAPTPFLGRQNTAVGKVQ